MDMMILFQMYVLQILNYFLRCVLGLSGCFL
jgi:hypothetical protein